MEFSPSPTSVPEAAFFDAGLTKWRSAMQSIACIDYVAD
jgi:hypothetical protein